MIFYKPYLHTNILECRGSKIIEKKSSFRYTAKEFRVLLHWFSYNDFSVSGVNGLWRTDKEKRRANRHAINPDTFELPCHITQLALWKLYIFTLSASTRLRTDYGRSIYAQWRDPASSHSRCPVCGVFLSAIVMWLVVGAQWAEQDTAVLQLVRVV